MSRRCPTPGELAAFYEALQALLRVYQFRDRDRACYGDITPHDCYALEAIERAGELLVSRLAAAQAGSGECSDVNGDCDSTRCVSQRLIMPNDSICELGQRNFFSLGM